jgi:thiol-disulfide isomerase/thioredoxin
MNRFRPALLFLSIFFLLGGCGDQAGGCRTSWAPPGDPLLGNPAPNFVLANLAGEKVELANVVSEKPVLLVFWATWCPSCVEEVPILNEWQEKYPELQILGVNVEESLERVQAFAETYQVRYPLLLDSDATTTRDYGLVGIPATVLVSKGGRVLYYGFSLPENIEQLIES